MNTSTKSMVFLLCASMLLVLCVACGTTPQAPSISPTVPPLGSDLITAGPSDAPDKDAPEACPRLHAMLYDLATADDPAALAAALNIPFEQGRVLVFVSFDSAVDFDQYGATLTTQLDDVAQVLVPLDELCPLANDPNVIAVRPPDMARPLRP